MLDKWGFDGPEGSVSRALPKKPLRFKYHPHTDIVTMYGKTWIQSPENYVATENKIPSGAGLYYLSGKYLYFAGNRTVYKIPGKVTGNLCSQLGP